ncbi:MAG: hypothetical protein L0G89_00030 [Janibacter sp.]|nr:hypothetical protein [Janibacter sp.]
MFGIERAALWARRHGITRVALEDALRSGDLPAGTLPGGGWAIGAEELEAWIDRQVEADR